MRTRTDCSGSHRYGSVRIDWQCERAADACRVKVYWGSALILDEPLNAGRRVRSFSVTSEQDPQLTVEGEFRFDPATDVLRLVYLRTPYGAWRDEVLCPSHPRPPPPEPTPPPDTEASEVLEGASDLFPYVYLRAWPSASDEDTRDRFVFYAKPDCPAGDPRLYCTLLTVEAASPDARQAMVRQAIDFAEGKPPYVDQFAPHASALRGEIAKFAGFSALMARRPQVDIATFIAELGRWLGQSWSQTIFYLGSDAFAQELDRAWQNVFALVIVLGYNRNGLGQMIRTATMAHLLQRMAVSMPPAAEDESVAPLPPADFWTPHRIREGVMATVVLPHPPFPLPPEAHADPQEAEHGLAASRASRVTPYAVGELRLVLRKLLRYEPGELSHIENVMAGERKTSVTRDRRMERATALERVGSRDDSRSTAEGRETSFEAQTRQALREQFRIDYETNYGPPTEAKQTGNVVVKPEGTDPTRAEDRARNALAREITTLAARRLTQEVELARVRETHHEHETEVRHAFDRRQAEGNVRGIYRWLHAVYRCWVASRGRRFMLELMLPHPARSFIAAQYDLAGVDLVEPRAPVDLGLDTFTGISLDPASDLYYAKLAARYGVDDVQPPPEPIVTLAATFESGSPLTMQVLTVPSGYAAQRASVALTATDAGYSASGTLGNRRFHVSAADADPTTVALSGQSVSLPLALTVAAPPSSSPPTASVGDAAATPGAWALAVEVETHVGATPIERWKSELYARLMAGYRRQRRAYLDASGAPAAPNDAPNTLAWRTAVREEIKRGGLRALARVVAQRTGERGRELRFLPALLVYFEQAFEWAEMSYSFLVDLENNGHSAVRRVSGEDEALTAFLQAAYARVLLPVTPGREFGTAFFLATGMVWDADDELAPTFEVAIAPETGAGATRWIDLVNDLKQDDPQGMAVLEPGAHDAWTVVLPTTMTYLQEGSDLPVFDPPPKPA